MEYIRIRNWDKFQHYKDRNPPWIKLHRELLSHHSWVMGDDASKLLSIAIMLVSAATDNKIPNDPAYIQRIACLQQMPNLQPLLDSQFIEIIDKNGVVLASASKLHTNAIPETETETETEDKNTNAAKAACPYSEIVKIFGEELPTLPQPRTRTASRERSLRARWRENKDRQDVEWWRTFFAYIRNQCDFLMGRAPNQQSPPSWLNFDWLLKPDNFVKVIEGNYEGNSNGNHRQTSKPSLGERAEAIADRHLAAISSRNTDLPVEGNDIPVSPQVDRRYG